MAYGNTVVLLVSLVTVAASCHGSSNDSTVYCYPISEIYLDPPLLEEGAYVVSVHSTSVDSSCTATVTSASELTEQQCNGQISLYPDTQETITKDGVASPGPMYGVGSIAVHGAPSGESLDVRIERDGELLNEGTVTPVDTPGKGCAGHEPTATLSLAGP